MSRSDLCLALTAAHVLPEGDGPWTEPQRWLMEAGARLCGLGLDIETVVRLVRVGRTLADVEVDALVAEVKGGVAPEQALDRQRHRRRSVTRLVAAVRHGAVSQTMKRLTGIGEQFHEYTRELLHQPSPLFVARFGLESLLADARTAADGSRSAADCLLVGRLLISLGRYAEAARWLELSAAATPRYDALAHLAVSRTFLGLHEEARAAADHALAIDGRSMMALAFNAVVRAFEAGNTDDVLRAASAVHEALELIERSRAGVATDPSEEIEALLARGRVSLLMPHEFGIRKKGIADLERVLDLTRDDGALSPLGVADLYRLHAHYFLGMNHAEAGRPEAAASHLEQVIVIDPACPFAERAYRRMGEG